jgi:hypothetical protein
MPIFSFPGEARWNEDTQSIEFEIEIGEYRGVVRVPRRVFQSLPGGSSKPDECLARFHMNQAAFERIAERKVRARDLAEDGNLTITPRDLLRLDKDPEGL